MSDYIIDIENAMIAKASAATRVDPQTKESRAFWNKCVTFTGQKGDEFGELARNTAPAVYFRLDRAINATKPYETAMSLGKLMSEGASENRELLIWSLFVCTKSLLSIAQQTLGGVNAVGAYDAMTLLIGPPGSPPSTAGQLRGFRPTTLCEPLFYVGRDLLGQSTAACVFELQFGTRVQL